MKYLKEQLNLHPSMQPQDVAKLCFQATFGAEHLLMDIDSARKFLIREYEQTFPRKEALYENISDEYCRVNLSAWKRCGYAIDDLFNLFLNTANTPSTASITDLEQMLCEVTIWSKNNALPFSFDAWKSFLSQYDRRPLHHSETYRQTEKPAYRVISRHLLDLSHFYR